MAKRVDEEAVNGKVAEIVPPLNLRPALLFPPCLKCAEKGLLIPLSDYGQEGSSVSIKAWVCTNPDCGFSIRIDKGEVSYGKRIEPKR